MKMEEVAILEANISGDDEVQRLGQNNIPMGYICGTLWQR